MNYKREIRLDWNILSVYFIQNGDLSLALAHAQYYTESITVHDSQIQDIKLESHKYEYSCVYKTEHHAVMVQS